MDSALRSHADSALRTHSAGPPVRAHNTAPARRQPTYTGAPASLLELQRLAGNRAVNSALTGAIGAPSRSKASPSTSTLLALQRQQLLPVQGAFDFVKYRGLSAQEKAAWKSSGLDPKADKEMYKSDKGLLSPSKEMSVLSLSKSDGARSFLGRQGYWPWLRVVDYLASFRTKKTFSNWENLGTLPKLQIATRVWRVTGEGSKAGEVANYRQTPAFQKALSASGKRDEVHERDAEVWANTLKKPEETGAQTEEQKKMAARASNAIDILRRLFLVLQTRLEYTKDGLTFEQWSGPIAAALSHGGRVNIRIPKAMKPGEEHQFFNWLFASDATKFATRGQRIKNWLSGKSRVPEASGLHRRTAGTHHVKMTSAGAMKEERGKGAFFKSLTDSGYVHLGMDVPVGGYGQKDINGDVILPDGRNGHLYIGYLAPTTQRDGALLIGCEGDAPGKTNPLGHHHDARAISEEMSAVGVPKTAGMTSRKAGGIVVDLSAAASEDSKWFSNLKELETHIKDGTEETRKALVGPSGAFEKAMGDKGMMWELAI